MTAVSLDAVMQAVATVIGAAGITVDGETLTIQPFTPGQITPPAAVVDVPKVPSYRESMGRAVVRVELDIYVFTSANVDDVGQKRLALLANPGGSGSLVAVIDSDPTLGGVVDSAYVSEFRPLNIEEFGLIGFYGGIFSVVIYAKGK